MAQHRLVVDRKVIERDAQTENPKFSLIYQMTRITRDKGCLQKDDRLDALAMAVGYWSEAMARDSATRCPGPLRGPAGGRAAQVLRAVHRPEDRPRYVDDGLIGGHL
jgi:hypothetical protein